MRKSKSWLVIAVISVISLLLLLFYFTIYPIVPGAGYLLIVLIVIAFVSECKCFSELKKERGGVKKDGT